MGDERSPTTPGGAVAGAPDTGEGLSRVALVVVLTAQLVVVLDFSIVNVALPSISTAFHASSTSVQWVVTGYAVTFGGLLILGGRAADLFGRRRLLVVGMVAFAIGSAAGGVAPNLAALIAARAVQGVAAAVVAPAALSILTTRFPDGSARTRVLGYYGIMSSAGFVAGLVLGGVLVEAAGWRAVFFVNVPVGLLGAAVGARTVPPDLPSASPRHLDLVGAGLVTAGVASLVYAPTAGVDDGWTSPALFLALAAAVVLLAAFVWHEQRTSHPLMPLSIFRSSTLVVGDGVSFLVGAWNAAQVLILSLFCQQVLGYSPLVTGLVVVPQGVAGLLRGLIGPAVVARLGIKRFLAASAAITAVGLALLLRFSATSHYPLLGAVLLLAGLGTTSATFAATIAGTSGVRDDEQGLASALVNTARQAGAAIGVAAMLALVASRTRSSQGSSVALAHAYRLAMGALAVFPVVACVLALTGIRDRVSGAHHDRLRQHHLAHPWPMPEFLAHPVGATSRRGENQSGSRQDA